jgi:hypothetical protein
MATNSMKVGAAVLGGVALVGAAFWAGSSMVDSPKEAASGTATSTAPTSPTTSAPGGLVEFRDDRGGWAISYPKSWNVLQSSDADVALVVAEKAPEVNQGGSILARNLTLAAPVDESALPAAREITDRIVTSGEGIQLLAQPTVIHQGGLPGYFYFYSFKDPASGQEGAHTHYFLFKGPTMISFVFQALPKEEFQGLAKLFDEVIATFRVIPPGD